MPKQDSLLDDAPELSMHHCKRDFYKRVYWSPIFFSNLLTKRHLPIRVECHGKWKLPINQSTRLGQTNRIKPYNATTVINLTRIYIDHSQTHSHGVTVQLFRSGARNYPSDQTYLYCNPIVALSRYTYVSKWYREEVKVGWYDGEKGLPLSDRCSLHLMAVTPRDQNSYLVRSSKPRSTLPARTCVYSLSTTDTTWYSNHYRALRFKSRENYVLRKRGRTVYTPAGPLPTGSDRHVHFVNCKFAYRSICVYCCVVHALRYTRHCVSLKESLISGTVFSKASLGILSELRFYRSSYRWRVVRAELVFW